MKIKNKWLIRLLVFAFWIILWAAAARWIHNPILAAGPVDTMRALIRLAGTADFYRSILNSMLRILLGLIAGGILGVLFGALCYRFALLRTVISPAVAAMKSVPVASFVILILIWAGSRNLAFFIVLFVSFPILYLNTLSGLMATPAEMTEMVQIFHMPLVRRIRYLYLPQLQPFLESAFTLALGMSFKSGVAAEVIGQPLLSIGNGLYRAKIYLNTEEVFAWTIVILLISWGLESGIAKLIGRKKRKAAEEDGAA